MKIRAQGVTNVGLVRDHNEDSLLVDVENGVFAVADGVGGMPGGDVASAAAVGAIKTGLKKNGPELLQNLPDLAELAHQAVRRAGEGFPGDNIATTLTLAHLAEGSVRVVHVGDSFALLIRNGRCQPLTREHNIENERADLESLAPFPPRYRYALTRVLGQLEPLVADVFEQRLEAGDWLIVTTDGLTDMVDFQKIAALCAQAGEIEPAVKMLLEAALAQGGHDNITFIVVAVDEA